MIRFVCKGHLLTYTHVPRKIHVPPYVRYKRACEMTYSQCWDGIILSHGEKDIRGWSGGTQRVNRETIVRILLTASFNFAKRSWSALLEYLCSILMQWLKFVEKKTCLIFIFLKNKNWKFVFQTFFILCCKHYIICKKDKAIKYYREK